VIAGIGLDLILEPHGRGDRYRQILGNLGSFEPDTLEWRAERHLRAIGADPEGLLLLLDASVSTPAAEIAAVETPTLVAVGTDDHVHRSAVQLAELLPRASFESVPDSHTRAIRRPEFGEAIAAYLGPADPAARAWVKPLRRALPPT
jgi:pimeloyl-ACP methyl ester carboxylesterase